MEEEDMEATTEEEYMEGIIPEECMGGTIHDKSMEKSIDDESMEGIIDDEIMEETIYDEIMEGIIHDESMEETMMEEGGVEAFKVKDTKETKSTAQYVEEENDEEENDLHPYIKMMRSPLVVEGFLIKNKDNITNIRKESKDLINEALLSDDKKKNGKENKNHGEKAKKGRRAILFLFRLFGR
ncbi:uncharacterized protein LOC125680361 [Ostrea edulis]|uniref:uncharacterized protein LOC125680361 n=1 Tax=Ostrea edulis TaxID=37623 RepID=UPI0024AFA14B|nr:uncharacterized protein LOC125680361 [Ostrea edulis]